jgi:hypothetical protein
LLAVLAAAKRFRPIFERSVPLVDWWVQHVALLAVDAQHWADKGVGSARTAECRMGCDRLVANLEVSD